MAKIIHRVIGVSLFGWVSLTINLISIQQPFEGGEHGAVRCGSARFWPKKFEPHRTACVAPPHRTEPNFGFKPISRLLEASLRISSLKTQFLHCELVLVMD